MQPDEWVVLADQGSDSELLYLEAVLQEERIETMFDPYRPGQWVSAGYGGPRPVRLLVMQRDLERAQQILVDLESSKPAEAEDQDVAEAETGGDEDDAWYESDLDTLEPPSPDADPRLASFRPPMDKPINPGCATLLLPLVAALVLLIMS